MYFIECLTYYILYPLEQLDGCLSPGEGQIPVQNGEWHAPHGQGFASTVRLVWCKQARSNSR